MYKEKEKWSAKKVKVAGWIRTTRSTKSFGFIELNDGTFFKNVQIVFDEQLENFAEICKFGVSSAIIVEGILELTPQAKQPFEIKATNIELEGASPQDYPLQKKRHSFEFLRTIAHFVRAAIRFQQYFAFVLSLLLPFTSFFRNKVSCMFTRP